MLSNEYFNLHFKSRRGVFESQDDISGDRILLNYKLPLNEIILDFFDKLKKATSGYARFHFKKRV